MLAQILERISDASNRFEAARTAIPEAVLGGDDRALSKLRKQREESLRDLEDLREAEHLAKRLEAERRADEAESARRAALTRLRAMAEERNAAAEDVDRALEELEAAYVRHEDLTQAMAPVLRDAGRPDDAVQVRRMRKPWLRWALWKLAPTCVEAMDAPRLPASRWARFADTSTRIPQIPADDPLDD